MTKVFFEKIEGDSYSIQSSAAHSLLKKKLAEYIGCSDAEFTILKDEKGKPYLKDIPVVCLSISHTKGAVMVGFSNRPIGVDIECVKMRRKSVESRVFTESETTLIDSAKDEDLAFFHLWTLKESYLKAIGTGFLDNAKDIEFYSLSNPVKSNTEDFSFETGEWEGFVFSICEKNDY